MSEMILYSFRRCPFAIRVRMTLEEKGLIYQTIEEDLAHLSQELMNLHPQGRVPLLVHDGTVIYESSIITEYLDEVFSAPKLMPSTPINKTKVRLWTHWCDQILKPDLDSFKYEWSTLDTDKKNILESRMSEHLKKLSDPLTNGPYLLGQELTLADIHVMPFYRQLQKSRADFHDRFGTVLPIEQWFERMTSRPSFIQAMKKI